MTSALGRQLGAKWTGLIHCFVYRTHALQRRLLSTQDVAEISTKSPDFFPVLPANNPKQWCEFTPIPHKSNRLLKCDVLCTNRCRAKRWRRDCVLRCKRFDWIHSLGKELRNAARWLLESAGFHIHQLCAKSERTAANEVINFTLESQLTLPVPECPDYQRKSKLFPLTFPEGG